MVLPCTKLACFIGLVSALKEGHCCSWPLGGNTALAACHSYLSVQLSPCPACSKTMATHMPWERCRPHMVCSAFVLPLGGHTGLNAPCPAPGVQASLCPACRETIANLGPWEAMQVSVAAALHPSFFPWAAARGGAVRCLTIWPPLKSGPRFWREGEDRQLEGPAAARFQAAQARFQASCRQTPCAPSPGLVSWRVLQLHHPVPQVCVLRVLQLSSCRRYSPASRPAMVRQHCAPPVLLWQLIPLSSCQLRLASLLQTSLLSFWAHMCFCPSPSCTTHLRCSWQQAMLAIACLPRSVVLPC